ncbi:MAG: hypothetical protein H8F28_15310, partial [Fibrella sp.]|nr:hypothetical protein [Armatimonadota bacterium]
MRKLSAVLFVVSLFFVSLVRPVSAQGRPAEKGAVGNTIHFTLKAEESKDIAISLPKGDYVIQADLKLVEQKDTNMQMEVDLLKTNGVMVEKRVLFANAVHRVARVAKPLRLVKPLGARLRVTNDSEPMEFWLTVIPAAKRTFLPLAYSSEAIGTLGIGEANGKGGMLAKSPEDGFYHYHKVALPAGRYDISLYLKQTNGVSSNLQGAVTLLDTFGAPDKTDWKLTVN